MHWKIKANIQNAISLLPSSFSYAAYYWLQRHFGGLRSINPVNGLTAALGVWNQIKKQNRDPAGKVFFEVGTGRIPIVPMAFWLMGARGIITVDLNPYMKVELIRECIRFVADNQHEIRQLFGLSLDQKRFDTLLGLAGDVNFHKSIFLQTFLRSCNINYIAPGDAARTGLSSDSIDFHTSNNVLEHIPPAILKSILEEGNRIIRPGGLFVHRIDYSDHFSHSDYTISPINFLQYDDVKWGRYADNRYMYMNRLRHDDFMDLFQSMGHTILASEPSMHKGSFELLNSGSFKVDNRFKNKSKEILATTESWVVSQVR